MLNLLKSHLTSSKRSFSSHVLRSVSLPFDSHPGPPDFLQLSVRLGDLTLEEVDAIVNPANSQLAHGGGVALAIRRQAGQEIQEESDRWVREQGPVRTGEVAVTGPGRITKCKHVIHAVGPKWQKVSAQSLNDDRALTMSKSY